VSRHLHALPGDGSGPMDPTPRGWDQHAWTRALGAARRALEADRLARETYPPTVVGYVEFNRARGRIMAELDRAAEQGKPQVIGVQWEPQSGPARRESPGPWPPPTREVRA
jgi:hypothetical protein